MQLGDTEDVHVLAKDGVGGCGPDGEAVTTALVSAACAGAFASSLLPAPASVCVTCSAGAFALRSAIAGSLVAAAVLSLCSAGAFALLSAPAGSLVAAAVL